MKRQRIKFKLLALFLFGLIALLAVYGGYSVTRYGNRWFASNRNPRVRAQKESVIPGDILDRTGLPLATSDQEGRRIYPQPAALRRALVHVVGDREGQVSNSVEIFQTSYLYGFHASIGEQLHRLWTGEEPRGDTVTLCVSASLCEEMVRAFTAAGGTRGAAVVMNWRTGEVLGLISLPDFDPDAITEAVKQDAGQPFWNRALQAIYPPGSTFKLITAEAAITGLEDAAELRFTCEAGVLALPGGGRISDYGTQGHGSLDIPGALKVSCNKAFASLALRLGQRQLLLAAERFGYNDNFLFRDLVVENSRFPVGQQTEQELAACGFGQSSVAATPLHMCMVAAAIANDGVMMEPRLVRSVKASGGGERLPFTSAVYRRATGAEAAGQLRAAMRGVVTGGTGRRADVTGMAICGKTGTADSTEDGSPVTYGWFVGFSAAEELPFALSVLVENVAPGETGGTAAAPVAGEIFTWLSRHAQELLN